ncbi:MULTISPECIES: lasso peptide biosynthesis PqqD family chaperone [unclassified Streptomyces]|uniref:lasso peptide biosynthesis PqqD family chaperone n=1 Tax=unclassified Streptomyces TaxID=2593676 RepID=UPI00278BFDC5|nr:MULTISPECIES: lasso peptide biosynthesis PqqD family chaperone [unclassified Streptomyces]
MRLNDGIVVTTTDYGGVLLDQRGGTYWQLNDSATVVAIAAAQGYDAGTAVDRLVAAFAVDRAQAEADVSELTQQLVDAKLATP